MNRYITPYCCSKSAIDQALEDKRRNLLSRISQTDNDDETTSEDLVSELKTSYNETISEQWRRRRGAFADPLVALPEDVWQIIISDVVADRLSYGPLIDLLNVSQAWMMKLMSYPAVWTMITISLHEEDLLAKISMSLHLSQQSPMTLKVEGIDPGSTLQDVWNLLAQHRDRFNVIWVLSRPPLGPEIPSIIGRLGGLPYLERISVAEPGITIVDLSTIYPSTPTLREVNQVQVPFSETVTDVGPLLHMGVTISIRLPSLPLLRDQKNRLSFKSLRYLNLTGRSSICQDFINYLDCPLASLTIGNLTLSDIEELIRSLSRFPDLQSLKLHTVLEEGTAEQWAQSTDPLPVLSTKILSVELFYSSEHQIGSGRRYYEVDKDMKFVSRLLANSMIHLESLTLRGFIITKDVASMLRSLLQLRSLSICTRTGSHFEELPPIHLAKLESLEWGYSSGYSYEQHPLRADSLTSYEFRPGSFGSLISEAIFLPRECSHALVRLTISSYQPISFSLLSLPALRELEFAPGTQSWWASDIIEQLIVIPSVCPSLEKISFNYRYRDWDMLLLALERRNFHEDHTVSPIREIHVEKSLPYKLLYLIVRLLGGRFTPYTIDEFAADRFCHTPDSNRCIDCGHDVGIFKTPLVNFISELPLIHWGGMIKSGWTYDLAIDGEKVERPLKEEVQHWLTEKWSRRRGYLEYVGEAKKQDLGFRRCSICCGSEPMIVTAYTLGSIDEGQ